MRRHLDAGYTMVKMKVGGLPLDEDLRRLEAVLDVVGSGERLAVDANAKFDRAEALRYAQALAPFRLRWFEEPCDPLDYALFAELASRLRAAARHRRKPLLDAGRAEPDALRRLARTARHHPGRSAAGLRHRRNTRARSRCWRRTAGRARLCSRTAATRCRSPSPPVSALGGSESYPGVFGDFGGFADDARIENGSIALSDRPGIGFEGQGALYRIMRALAGV